MKITNKDISRALKVSPTTVSKALLNYSDIGNQTKERVKAYAKKVGYEPNVQAAFLRTKKTKLIGVVVPNLHSEFYTNLVDKLVKEISGHGYLPIVLNSNELEHLERENLERLLHQRVDGIFISLTKNTTSSDHLTKIIASDSALVLFNNISKLISCNKVVFNDKEIIKKTTDYLIKKGCEKIAFIRKSLISQNSINQFIGYQEAHNENNLSFNNKRVIISENDTIIEGYCIAENLFNGSVQIDAFISFNDNLSIGAMRFYQEQEFAIPNDIRFIGQENSKISDFFTPKLTSIEQDTALMAQKVMALFLEEQSFIRQHKIVSFETEEIKATLINRESSS
jgi:LacI family transcriptional regulator|tara:strand:+ start:214 stop:1230 length:1017 start_codon:yes stop_codon:yes gene_type:complete